MDLFRPIHSFLLSGAIKWPLMDLPPLCRPLDSVSLFGLFPAVSFPLIVSTCVSLPVPLFVSCIYTHLISLFSVVLSDPVFRAVSTSLFIPRYLNDIDRLTLRIVYPICTSAILLLVNDPISNLTHCLSMTILCLNPLYCRNLYLITWFDFA